jgi:hypothetical protein
LATDRAEGNRRIYRVDPDALTARRDQLDRFWEKAPAASKTTVEEPNQEEGRSTV